MRRLALILISISFIVSCSNDVAPLGGNFDKVLYSETKDTLYVFYSNTNFEAYLKPTNEFVRGSWRYISVSPDGGQTILGASGLRRRACDGIALSGFPLTEVEITSLEVAPSEEFVYCD
ncbi:hypothetical protein [Flammeovirga sp. SJP92]|uniref:hypothetical protein n=1 Tax=Flammeovirga sp. SJP92 TaxID=1775430 RepID=UPI000787B5DC|nr:hypothetical protein [Flammeovirga sp. SJP92]KXX70004.1 hypothetical protein AVL50_14095 [Flammeovirga sp. SJP92]